MSLTIPRSLFRPLGLVSVIAQLQRVFAMVVRRLLVTPTYPVAYRRPL